MKKVKKDDIEYLIQKYYYIFLDPNKKGDEDIFITSVFVKISVDSKKINFKDIDISEFSKQLEAITFGNLKVTYYDSSTIFIANAYEFY